MSWLQHDLPSFAYITARGDLILFDELQSEVRHGLSETGTVVDHWPLTATLQTIRAITVACEDGEQIPTAQILIEEITQGLRTRRILLSESMIRAILAEYLKQLRRHDIARVQYF